MISVIVKRTKKIIETIKITGHAGYDLYEKDVVCAAVTGIVSGSLNALDQLFDSKVDLKVKHNEIEINVKELINQSIQQMLEFMLIQLKTIEVQYQKYVQIKEK